MTAHTANTPNTVTRELGLTGRLVVGGTVSTGMLVGGYVVGAMALAGRMNGGALLPTSIGLFMMGAVAGLLISVVFGLAGREEGWSLDDAIRSAGKGVLYAIPATAIGAVLAGWVAMAMVALYAGKTLAIGGSILAAVVGLGIMMTTFEATCDCGANALRRVRQAI